jgi:hypothetical protein
MQEVDRKTTILTRQAALSLVAFTLSASCPAFAQSDSAEAARSAKEGLFKSSDLNHDSKITRPEITHLTDLVVSAIDADGDDILTVTEFPAMGSLDLNKDGVLEHEELSAANLVNYYEADRNKDRSVDIDEFAERYSFIVQSRAVPQ